MPKFFSAERGWSRSGDRARRSNGDPGSADFGLDSARCLAAGETDNEAPGLKSCVECELPGGWWTWMGNAKGLGERVGETGKGCCCGSGDGEGVRASGDRGMWPADFRLEGECIFLATEWSLFLRPCREEGRWGWKWRAAEDGGPDAGFIWPLAGLLGTDELGELDGVDRGESEAGLEAANWLQWWRKIGGEYPDVDERLPGEFDPDSWDGNDRLNDWKLRLGVRTGEDEPP